MKSRVGQISYMIYYVHSEYVCVLFKNKCVAKLEVRSCQTTGSLASWFLQIKCTATSTAEASIKYGAAKSSPEQKLHCLRRRLRKWDMNNENKNVYIEEKVCFIASTFDNVFRYNNNENI